MCCFIGDYILFQELWSRGRFAPKMKIGFHEIVWFTADKNQKGVYAIYALPEKEKLPNVIEWERNPPAKGTKMTLLQNNKSVKWKTEGTKTIVFLPKSLKNEPLVLSYNIR